jgi:hypothetical protein
MMGEGIPKHSPLARFSGEPAKGADELRIDRVKQGEANPLDPLSHKRILVLVGADAGYNDEGDKMDKKTQDKKISEVRRSEP